MKLKLKNGYEIECSSYMTTNTSMILFINNDTFGEMDAILYQMTEENLSEISIEDKKFNNVKFVNMATSCNSNHEYSSNLELCLYDLTEMNNRLSMLESSQSDQDDALVELADIIAG